MLGAGGGVGRRQLQHQIGAAGEGHAGAFVFVEDGRGAALDEITAHDGNDIVGAGFFTAFG